MVITVGKIANKHISPKCQCYLDTVWKSGKCFFYSGVSYFYLTWKTHGRHESCSLQEGPRQSREIISTSISYSWSLFHTPEIVLWSSLLCRHREEPSVKWHPTSSHREQQIRVGTHRERVIVLACLCRPFSKLILVNKLIWATPVGRSSPTKTNWQHADSIMEEWSFSERFFQEL